MRFTREIQQWEIETYNPTRPDDDKFISGDYMCKKSAYDRDILNKLGKVEDILESHKIETLEELDNLLSYIQKVKAIEEELGIDLVTLFKASHCFYSNILDCYCPHPNPIFKTCGEKGEWYINFMSTSHKLKNYGKTWALTKSELKRIKITKER